MTDLPQAHVRRAKGAWHGAADAVVLDYDARFLRRKRLTTRAGDSVLVDLAEVTNLAHGDALELTDGRLIEVLAAAEEVLVITGDLARLAWHIGNRHTPCQVEAGRLVIKVDHVLEAMLRGLGAEVTRAVEAFTPEMGAYGTGRTMGHSHGDDFGSFHDHGDGLVHFHPAPGGRLPIGHRDAKG
jgi:urease accessory protein